MAATDWLIVAINVGSVVGAIVAGLVIHAFVFIALKRMAARGHRMLEDFDHASLRRAAPTNFPAARP
jgi:hypothetical protein